MILEKDVTSIKNPFLVFCAIISFLVVSSLFFIQSHAFAGLFKKVVFKYLPRDTGIEADFGEFAIKMFPPALSLKSPVITLRDRNILKMPGGTSVKAERIDFEFQPFQMLSGNIRVKELTIVNGSLQLFYDPGSQKPAAGKGKFSSLMGSRSLPLNFSWDQLFQIHAEAVGMQNMKVRVDWIGSTDYAEVQLNSVRLAQWYGKGGLGYEINTDLTGMSGSFIRQFPEIRALDRVQLAARVNEAGITFDSLTVRGTGLSASAHGKIRGNIQKPAGLVLDGDLQVSGDLARAASEIAPSLDVEGTFGFDGKVRADLDKFLETLKLEGKLIATDFRYRHFWSDHAEAEGSWAASPDGGELALKRAELKSRDRPRTAAITASGGHVVLTDLHYKIGSSEAVKVNLQLDRAQVQWLGALALEPVKSIFPLLTRITGAVDATVRMGRSTTQLMNPLDAQAKIKLQLDDFQLDNQKMGEARPLHKIFAVPRILLEGPLAFDKAGLHVDQLQVELPRSKMILAGAIAKGGFNIHAGGPVNLEDLGQIAENDIRGTGNLDVAVTGPVQQIMVDIDADLQNAYYLRLLYGSVKGRITWDDDHNRVILKNARGVRGDSEYSVNGTVDVGKHESVALTVAVPKATIQDFTQIFHDLTSDLSWFPFSLSGPMSGSVNVSGGLKISELRAIAKVSGTDWDYLGERFSKVELTGGLDRGTYLLSSFSAVKRTGRISGRISVTDDGLFDWDIHSQQLTFNDLDHIVRLDVPMRGTLKLDSSGKGKEGVIRSQTQMSVTDVSVRGASMPSSQLVVSTSNGILTANGTALGGEGTLALKYDFNPTNFSNLKIDFHRLDFSPILLLLNSKSITDATLTGYASGAANLSFRSGEMERASGEIALTEYLLARSDAQFRLAHPISFRMSDGTFDLTNAAISGNHGRVDMELRSRKAQLDGTIRGDLDLSLIEFFTSAVSRTSGTAGVDFSIAGTLRAPILTGRVSPASPSVWVDGMDSPFENITGNLELRGGGVVEVSGFEADLASGRAKAEGKILLFTDRQPELNLRIDIQNSKLKIYPFQSVKLNGNLLVTGEQVPYLVEGDFGIDSAISKEKVMQRSQSAGLKSIQYTPPPGSLKAGDYPKFKLKIDVHADRGIVVQNELFDAEFKERLTIINTIEAPRLLGSVDLVQGKMKFKDHEFQIQSMGATFDNPAVINPKVNLTARTEVSGVKVQLYATGTVDDLKNLKVELTSTPTMSESDILSLLTIGMTPTDTKRLSASDLAAVQQGEAASLLLNSLDFNREVANKTGLQVQLDESVNPYVGASVFRPQAAGETSVSPKLVVRKQVTKDIDLSYGSTVGVGSGSEQEVNMELKMTPAASLIGVWDNYQSLDTGARQTSYGLDFKLQKRFK
ncbi:MAG: translocation/assembly module TamB domain-containing protein [Oligoflexia bacterium]|nr:translocation/assembly module TamB domain-containing protein [Oligoflexia bacterium]